MKVVKATAQVLNTLWQYRDLRTIYKKVSTLGLMRTVLDVYMMFGFQQKRKTCLANTKRSEG